MRAVTSVGDEPCVWMAAGLVSYKLCDRDFDCARCPLDAALRGGAPDQADVAGLRDDGRRHQGFPPDRLYAPGHTWIARAGERGASLLRIGLDGFAAGLLPRPVALNVEGAPCELARGDVMCDLELPGGALPVAAPVAGRLARANPALAGRPELVVDSPYDDGWLVELESEQDPAAIDGLVDADRARDEAELHLRHFRRRLGLQLLADTAVVGVCMADGGERLASLSEILGGRQYLRVLRDVLR